MFAIYTIGMAGGRLRFTEPLFLKHFDSQTGEIVLTPNLGEAMGFATEHGAKKFLEKEPLDEPVRLTDGLPNRPLMAFNWGKMQL